MLVIEVLQLNLKKIIKVFYLSVILEKRVIYPRKALYSVQYSSRFILLLKLSIESLLCKRCLSNVI